MNYELQLCLGVVGPEVFSICLMRPALHGPVMQVTEGRASQPMLLELGKSVQLKLSAILRLIATLSTSTCCRRQRRTCPRQSWCKRLGWRQGTFRTRRLSSTSFPASGGLWRVRVRWPSSATMTWQSSCKSRRALVTLRRFLDVLAWDGYVWDSVFAVLLLDRIGRFSRKMDNSVQQQNNRQCELWGKLT